MSGRAGRRGLDATGVVIIMTNDNIPETTTLQQMILGIPGKLNSQFRLTFNLILNLLRVETLKVEDMIKRSFSENASQRLLPDQQKQVEEAEQRLTLLQKLDRETSLPDLDVLYNTSAALIDVNAYITDFALKHPQGSKMMGAGRVVLVRDNHFKGNLAVLLRPPKFLPTGASKTSKYYWVVGLTDEDTKNGKSGWCIGKFLCIILTQLQMLKPMTLLHAGQRHWMKEETDLYMIWSLFQVKVSRL